jgi:hypothetical protein
MIAQTGIVAGYNVAHFFTGAEVPYSRITDTFTGNSAEFVAKPSQAKQCGVWRVDRSSFGGAFVDQTDRFLTAFYFGHRS